MSAPRVTAVLAAHNEEKFVGQAIDSVLAQTAASFELIVVDDGSQDATAAVVSRYAGDGRVRLIRQTNHGLASSLNTGVAAGSAPLIALIDADDLWLPDHLEIALNTLAEAPEAGFAHTDGWRAHVETGRFQKQTYCEQMGMPSPPPTEPLTTAASLLDNNWMLGLPVIRRKAFATVGGFDESLQASEDYALWLNLLAHGYSTAFTGRPTLVLRSRVGSMSKEDRAMHASLALVHTAAAETMPFPDELRQQAAKRAAAMERLAHQLDRPSIPESKVRRLRRLAGRIQRATVGRGGWSSTPPDAVERAFPGFHWKLD